jgi:homoserine kinase type II
MAVYTAVSGAALDRFLAEYALGEARSLTPIAEGVENSNYRLETGAGRYILTLYERRVDPAELPWFLGLMEHLAARGITCPQPVRGRDGESLRALCGRPACVTTFLPGRWPRHVLPAHCAAVGESLARLHLAGRDYAPVRANALGPAGWPPLLARCGAGADTVAPGLHAELGAALAHVGAAWPDGLPRGHIHADLFPDNAFFEGDQITGIIDFYFAATDLLAYDLAVCLNAWCFGDDLRPCPARTEALLAGYERVRPLEPAERAALPVLCQGAALRFLLTRLYDWLNTPPDALVTRKDPLAYRARLRHYLAREAAPVR